MNIEDGTEYLGNSWIKCKSKSHSGHNYYFNTVTGESTWNLSDVELEKSPRSTKSHEEKPKNVHIDGCPEPKGPPEAHSEQARYSEEKSAEINQASSSNRYTSQIISNNFPKQSYPFAPFVTHVVAPNIAASLDLGISTSRLKSNVWGVPPALIVAHSISTMTSPAHSSNSQENHINVQNIVASQPTYTQTFNIPSLDSFQRKSNFSRKGRGKIIQKMGQAYQNRYKWTGHDLRHKLSANKCSKSFRHQGEYIEEGSEDDSNHFDEYEQASVSKAVYTKQEDEDEDNSYYSDADSDWLEEHLEGPDLTLNITNLKQLAASTADPYCWFIAADTSILSRHLHFLHILINSDTQCHLMVPQVVLSELQAIVNAGGGLHRKKYRAKRASEFLTRQLQTGRAVMGQVSSDSSHFENFIINCCLNLKRQNYHVVLLSNDPELQKYKNTTDIPFFTISQVKKFLSSKIVKRYEEDNEEKANHAEEDEQLESLKAPEPSFKKPIAMSETHHNIEITINNDAKISNINKEAPIKRTMQVTHDGKTSQIEKLKPAVQISTIAIDKETQIKRTAHVTDNGKISQIEKLKPAVQTSTSAIDKEAPIKLTAQVTDYGKTNLIEKLKPVVQTSTCAIDKEAPLKRKAPVTDGGKISQIEKLKPVVQTSTSALDKEAPIKQTAQVTNGDKTYQTEKLKVVVQTSTSAESDRTKSTIESNTIPIRRKIQLKRSTSNQTSANINDRVEKKNIKLWRKSRNASIPRTESQLSSANSGNPVNTADNTNSQIHSTLIDNSKTLRPISEQTENDAEKLPKNIESLRNSDTHSSALMQKNTDTVNITTSASLYGNSETSSSCFVQINIDSTKLPTNTALPRNRETNRSSFIHKNTETTNSPKNMTVGGTSSDFMQRNIDTTKLPTDDMLVENSDRCSSVFMQRTASRENITLEETSTSGIISNTTNNSQTNLEPNLELINAKVDQNIIFDIIDQNMEDYLRVRRDEWVSRFVQIMEEVLTEVLQQDPEFLPNVMPPPWNIFEATRCLYVRFRNNNDVIEAANKFSKILFKISHGTDRIDVETITPSQYIILYSYGVYLVDILQSIYKNSEDLQTASKSLSKLFSDIQDCNQNETFVDNPHECSESSVQQMSVSAVQDGESINRREADYTSISEPVEKDKRKESLQNKQLEQSTDVERNNIQLTLKVPSKPVFDKPVTPKKPNRRRTSSVFYNLRSKDRNLSSSSSNLNDSAKQSVLHNKPKQKKNLSQDKRDEGNNDQSIIVSRKQAAKDLDKNQNCPQISSESVTVSALDKPKSGTKNEKQKNSELRKKFHSNRENIESNFFTSLNLQKNYFVENDDDYSNVAGTRTYSQSCGSETLTGNSNSKINTDSNVDFKQKNVSKFARHISTSFEAENLTEPQELNFSNSASYATDSYAGEEYFLEDEYYKEEVEPVGDNEIQRFIQQIFDETKQSFANVSKFCKETFRDLKEISCSKNKKDEIHGKAVNAHIYLTRLNRALYSIFHRESDESENDFQSLLRNAGFKHKHSANKIFHEYSNSIAGFLDQANILLDAVNIIINGLQP